MQTDSIIWGEPYDIEVSAQDANENAILLDGTWSAAMRITRGSLGGTVLADISMTISGGKAIHSLDTSDESIFPNYGIYVYDVRITDPYGSDLWTEPVRLTLANRNTPPS